MLRGRHGVAPFVLAWLAIVVAAAIVMVAVLWFGGNLGQQFGAGD